MNGKTFRVISILLLILMMTFSFVSCAKEEKAAEPVVTEAPAVVEEPAATPEEPAAPAPKLRGRPTKPEAPTLPFEITPEMDFFKDGYEIVTVAALADGDTTTFNLKSGSMTTRYLAIDTPETSNGIQPWGPAAKNFVNDLLMNAEQIVLERDPVLTGAPGDPDGTLDKYGRLLAHVWVDGELVQWKVVEESLGKVAYLYYDYKYNDVLMKLEAYEMFSNPRRVNNSLDKDPDYDYTDKIYDVTLEELGKGYDGKRVHVTGICSGTIGKNGYIQTADGSHALYVYTQHTKFKGLQPGNEIDLLGRFSYYNGLPEIGSLEQAPIILSEGHEIVKYQGTTDFVDDMNMSKLVEIKGLVCDSVQGGYVTMHDAEGSVKVYVDKYLEFKAAEVFEPGKTYDVTGWVSIFNDAMQLKIGSTADVVEVL